MQATSSLSFAFLPTASKAVALEPKQHSHTPLNISCNVYDLDTRQRVRD